MIWLQSLLRRLSAPGSVGAALAAEAAGEDLPCGSHQTPEAPALQPSAKAHFLDYPEARRRLRQMELGLDDRASTDIQDRAHEQIVTAALAAISDPAAQKNYFPRRPNLLPELMHAINDESMSARQLVAIVARDPALVGSLLKVANSSFYRLSPQPIESIERAIVVLGNDGLRSVTAAALMQPIFQVSRAGAAPRFPELVWEHAIRSAHAAIPHAALVERANQFAAELLSLISGLAEIALFRAVIEHCTPSSEQDEIDPLVIASILDADSAAFAWHIGADWRLSAEMLAALEEQIASSSQPKTPLGRSLRFGRHAGALAVLHTNSIISDATLRGSLPPSGLSPAHLDLMLTRLLRPHDDPRMRARA